MLLVVFTERKRIEKTLKKAVKRMIRELKRLMTSTLIGAALLRVKGQSE